MADIDNLPVWPGSSSFSTGSTPFGFFDTDSTFASHADRVANWCATRLGYPTLDVELIDIQFYACFEEAVLEYSNQVNQFQIKDNLFQLQGTSVSNNFTGKPANYTLDRLISVTKNYGSEAGSGGHLTYKTASLQVVKDKQVYSFDEFSFEDVNDTASDIEIRKVFHTTPPAIVRYFDPFVGTGMGSQQMLEGFGWGSYSPSVSFLMMPIYADLLRLQAIEFNDTVRKSAFSFEITGDRLRLFPRPTYDYTLYIDYVSLKDRTSSSMLYNSDVVGDFSNAPYQLHEYSKINSAGRQWIFKYTLALCKEVLGSIRGKYSSIPIPDSELTLNYSDLLSQASNEKTELITQLRETLESSSRSEQIRRLTEESDNIQNQLTKIPIGIYIG